MISATWSWEAICHRPWSRKKVKLRNFFFEWNFFTCIIKGKESISAQRALRAILLLCRFGFGGRLSERCCFVCGFDRSFWSEWCLKPLIGFVFSHAPLSWCPVEWFVYLWLSPCWEVGFKALVLGWLSLGKRKQLRQDYFASNCAPLL